MRGGAGWRGARPRAVARVGWAVAVLVAAAAAFVLGRATFVPPQVATAADEPLTTTVTEGTVGRSLPLTVVARWDAAGAGVSAADGTLTSVAVSDGAVVAAGDVLFTVDLRPVTVLPGAVPSFRDLSAGAVGDDVAQLQRFLTATDRLVDPGRGLGTFGAATTTAVRAWQRDLGITPDGTVRAADVVFVPELPARVRVATDVEVGDRLSPGTPVVEVLAAAPGFSATLADGADVPPPGAAAAVGYEGAEVDVVVADVTTDTNGYTVLHLARPDGAAVCGETCGNVPTDPGSAVYTGRQVLVPETSGPTVPLAAVRTDPEGATYVRARDGVRVPVRVVAQGGGRAVLEGVEVGTVVQVAEDVP